MSDVLDQILTHGLERLAERGVPDDGPIALPVRPLGRADTRPSLRLVAAAATVVALIVGAVALASRNTAPDTQAAGPEATATRLDLPPIELARDARGWVVGDQFVVWGGRTGLLPPREISTEVSGEPARGAILDLDGLTWRDLPEPPLSGRIRPASAVIGDQIYVLGGLIPEQGAASDGARYDVSDGSWEPIADPPPDLCPQTATALGGLIYAVGLCHGGDQMPFAAYDPATDSWRELPPAPPVAGTLLVRGQGLALFGDGGGALWSSADERWQQIPGFPEIPAPAQTGNHPIALHTSLPDGRIIAIVGAAVTADGPHGTFIAFLDRAGEWSAPQLLPFGEENASYPEAEPAVIVGRRVVWPSALGLAWLDLDTGEVGETGRFVDGVPVDRLSAVMVALNANRLLIYGGQLALSDEDRTDTGPVIITLP
jgi:hypothetical protein